MQRYRTILCLWACVVCILLHSSHVLLFFATTYDHPLPSIESSSTNRSNTLVITSMSPSATFRKIGSNVYGDYNDNTLLHRVSVEYIMQLLPEPECTTCSRNNDDRRRRWPGAYLVAAEEYYAKLCAETRCARTCDIDGTDGDSGNVCEFCYRLYRQWHCDDTHE